jgi:dihydrofolate reductase
MALTAILAMGLNGVIGRHDGSLPWRLRADLQWFRSQTIGKPCIVGRKTWESLGLDLPGRSVTVLSRRQGQPYPTCPSTWLALRRSVWAPETMVIGGGQVYRELIPQCDRVLLTLVNAKPLGCEHLPGDLVTDLLCRWRWRPLWEKDADSFNYPDFSVWELTNPSKRLSL